MSSEHVEHPMLCIWGLGKGVRGDSMIETGVGILQIVGHDIVVIVVDEQHVEIVGLVVGMDLLGIVEVITPNIVPVDEGLVLGKGNYVGKSVDSGIFRRLL